jgi:hypothetical protein
MIVAPIPVLLPLPLTGAIPIDIALMTLFKVHVVRAILVAVPFVIVSVVLVEVALIVSVTVVAIMPIMMFIVVAILRQQTNGRQQCRC